MSKIYLVTEYVYGDHGNVLGSEPVAALGNVDEALDFIDTHGLDYNPHKTIDDILAELD